MAASFYYVSAYYYVWVTARGGHVFETLGASFFCVPPRIVLYVCSGKEFGFRYYWLRTCMLKYAYAGVWRMLTYAYAGVY